MSSLLRFFGTRNTESPENSETAESEKNGKRDSEKKSPWSKFDDFPLEEKRKLYKCGKDYVTLKEIPTWPEYRKENLYAIYRKKGKRNEKPTSEVNETLNEKISLWQGDITTLEIDAIVNAANNSLLGGGGVDGCIHRAAGSTLRQECARLDGCSTGDAKITSGHKLPAKYVIHTVGPFGKQERALKSCYKKCLHLVKKHGVRTVAFCCVSTGIYGYPIYDASCVALNTIRKWLEHIDGDGNKNADLVDRIIICVFLGGDLDVYEQLLPRYFPSADTFDQRSAQEEDENEDEKEHGSGRDKKDEHDLDKDKKKEHDSDKDKKEEHGSDKGKKKEHDSGKEKKDEHGLDKDKKKEHDSGKEKKEAEHGSGKDKMKENLAGNDKKDERESGKDEKGEHLKEGETKKEEEGEEEEEGGGGEEEEEEEEEDEDIEMDDAAIKEGVPTPPKLEELLDSQEEVTNVNLEEQVNKNLPPPEDQNSNTEEKPCDTSME